MVRNPARQARALAALAVHETPASAALGVRQAGRLTLVRFDALVIDQLGLADVAATVQRSAQRAGALNEAQTDDPPQPPTVTPSTRPPLAPPTHIYPTATARSDTVPRP